MWSIADIADALAHGLANAEAELLAEQAVNGLDARDELALHPVVEQAFREAGYGCHREVRYPADRRKRKESEGERCDFVLTPEARALAQPDRAGTLFDAPDPVPLDNAFWLEVKTARQFTPEGPNTRYSAQMLSVARRDVGKLSKDRHILHAALAMIAFVEDERTATHDMQVWYERYIAKGMPMSFPSTRTIPILDRHGNGICGIAIAGVSHL